MTRYAILGGGRLATHMGRYMSLLNQPCSRWARDPASPLNTHAIPDHRQRLLETVEPASHVLLLVSDDAILPLVRQYPFLREKRLVHCSGALSVPGIAGAHPLMTFADQPYDLETYRAIPFFVEEDRLERVLPGLPNPCYTIEKADKALYHALCVMAGNFPQILWQEVSRMFEDRLNIPPEVLHPYLERVVRNFLRDPQGSVTGPLVRGDGRTISRNIGALEGTALSEIYLAFIRHREAIGGRPGQLLEKAS